MKIEVGGVYKTRNGERVEILNDDASNEKWPYRGDNMLTYESNGLTDFDGCEVERDLIALWDEPSKSATILAEIEALALLHGMELTGCRSGNGVSVFTLGAK